jgi:histidinol dehydrogenase
VRESILAFQMGILNRDATLRHGPNCELRLRYRPLRRVGVCIPGGAAAYPSSLLMTVVPAQAAGVEEIAVVVPPTRFGGYNDDLLAACHALGVKEVHRVGGVQGVAALAYGVDGIAPVDKIVGPGNLFVALAKRHVYGEVDIDSIAGPSEVVLIADWTADPRYVASDLISQAEHSPGASVLITWEPDLIDRVADALVRQLAMLSRGDLARDSLERFGALILVRDEDEAVELTNLIAPEHLHVSTSDPDRLAARLVNAGAIFLGHDTPVAVGDYAAGPSHVLPTGGTARWASGLCSNDFLKRTSMIYVNRDGLAQLAPDIRMLADKEGLSAHRYSVDVRLEDPHPGA